MIRIQNLYDSVKNSDVVLRSVESSVEQELEKPGTQIRRNKKYLDVHYWLKSQDRIHLEFHSKLTMFTGKAVLIFKVPFPYIKMTHYTAYIHKAEEGHIKMRPIYKSVSSNPEIKNHYANDANRLALEPFYLAIFQIADWTHCIMLNTLDNAVKQIVNATQPK